VLTKIVPGPCPPEGASYVTAIWPDGPTAMSPKLPPLDPGADWAGPNAPTFAAPSPLTAAPRAEIPSPSW
jgi:hypothetical protein